MTSKKTVKVIEEKINLSTGKTISKKETLATEKEAHKLMYGNR